MAANVRMEIVGVRETLAALKKLDPELRKATVREIKAPARVMVATAKSRVPSQAPMSGWRGGERGSTGFPGWNDPRRGVKLKFGGRRRSNKKWWPLLQLSQDDAAGALFDMAGKKGGNGSPQSRQFLANVSRYGAPSRTIWPAVEQHKDQVTASVRVALAKAEAIVNKQTR